METVQITILAGFILFITQIITRGFPNANAMWVTLGVTAVVGLVGYFVDDTIGFITVLMALLVEGTGYDVITKGIIKPLRNAANK